MRTRARGALLSGLLLGAGIWACQPDATAPDTDGEPRFSNSADAVNANGGGRVDYPFGNANKRSKEKWYQTWGFDLKDPDGAGSTAPSGRLTLVDHREVVRQYCGGNPCQFKSISLEFVARPTESDCPAAREGSVFARGVVREVNTGEPYKFELLVCDNGEPGRTNREATAEGSDRFEFFLPDFPLLPEPHGDATQQYCLHEKPGDCRDNEPDGEEGAVLTGGNIQVIS